MCIAYSIFWTAQAFLLLSIYTLYVDIYIICNMYNIYYILYIYIILYIIYIQMLYAMHTPVIQNSAMLNFNNVTKCSLTYSQFD